MLGVARVSLLNHKRSLHKAIRHEALEHVETISAELRDRVLKHRKADGLLALEGQNQYPGGHHGNTHPLAHRRTFTQKGKSKNRHQH